MSLPSLQLVIGLGRVGKVTGLMMIMKAGRSRSLMQVPGPGGSGSADAVASVGHVWCWRSFARLVGCSERH